MVKSTLNTIVAIDTALDYLNSLSNDSELILETYVDCNNLQFFLTCRLYRKTKTSSDLLIHVDEKISSHESIEDCKNAITNKILIELLMPYYELNK